MKKEKVVQIACRIPWSMKKWIKKEAKDRDISEAELVRKIIELYSQYAN